MVRFLRKAFLAVALLGPLLLGSGVAYNAAAAPPPEWRVCEAPPWENPTRCVQRRTFDIDPQGRMIWATTKVDLPRVGAPQAVFVSAFASSRVYWDGKLIGGNGSPAGRAESERPGLRDAAIPIPSEALTAGTHSLTLQMSSMRGLLRIRSPVTTVRVGEYEGPRERVLRDYLPALVTAGGLLAAAAYFGLAFLFGRRTGSRPYLAAAALLGTGQLAAEASRAFIAYAYPSHVIRLGLILTFAVGLGFAIVGYAARRFEFRRPGLLIGLQAVLATTAILMAAHFDGKTALVLMSATAIAAAVAADATRRSQPGALPILIVFLICLASTALAPYTFLDRDLYLWLIMLFVVLFVDEARRAQSGAREQASDREEARVELGAAFPRMPLGFAGSQQFVLPEEIVRLAAADDYTEIFLATRSQLLHPEPLHKLLARLPDTFLRVHRSHAINLSHLRSFRKGARSSVRLSDESTAPVSRRRVQHLVDSLARAASGEGASKTDEASRGTSLPTGSLSG